MASTVPAVRRIDGSSGERAVPPPPRARDTPRRRGTRAHPLAQRRTSTLQSRCSYAPLTEVRLSFSSGPYPRPRPPTCILTPPRADGAIEALTAGLKSAAVVLFRRSVEEALRRGEVYVAFDGPDACGVAAWLSPRTDWRFQYVRTAVELGLTR